MLGMLTLQYFSWSPHATGLGLWRDFSFDEGDGEISVVPGSVKLLVTVELGLVKWVRTLEPMHVNIELAGWVQHITNLDQ